LNSFRTTWGYSSAGSASYTVNHPKTQGRLNGIKNRIISAQHGGIAQLGERLNGIQEVSGSIPLISTKKQPKTKVLGCFSNIRTIFIYGKVDPVPLEIC
jgi:hypothetical protein